ncbi:MAG: TolC family protein [Desulfobacteraceae bacterium]|nr:TolC family protein [Desulfobacteraceae bacterium]
MKICNIGLSAIGALIGFLLFSGIPSIADGTKNSVESRGPHEPSQVLTIREAIKSGIENNLDVKAEELGIPMGKEGVIASKSVFDPTLEASVGSTEQKNLSSTILSSDDFNLYRDIDAKAGIKKRFLTGLESSISLSTLKSMNNSSIDELRPQYNDVIVLDLTQPLLRDFGKDVNSAHIKISEKQLMQAANIYLDRAERIAGRIESLYYDLALAEKTLTYRIDSKKLAQELLEANKEKFKAGLVPVTEVQQAETAIASRDEDIIQARQQVETATNNLLDLLGARNRAASQDWIKTQSLSASDMEQKLPAFDEALAVALKKRPDLEAQRFYVESKDINLRYYKNQRLPRLDLKATLGLNGLSGGDRPVSFLGNTVSSHLVGDYWDSVQNMTHGHEWFVGMRFSYPIGNRGPEAMFRQADLERRQAVYRLKRLEDTVETDIKNALVNTHRGLERVKVAERFEHLAEITLSQEMDRLKEGLSDTFHILQYQNDVISAKIKKAAALADFNKGVASLYLSMGTNLDRYGIAAAVPDDIGKNKNSLTINY